jgi:hypothetical protein
MCAQNEFLSQTFVQYGTKKTDHQSRRYWSIVMSGIDAGITLLVFCVCLWMNNQEMDEIKTADMYTCTAEDYTLRVMYLKCEILFLATKRTTPP